MKTKSDPNAASVQDPTALIEQELASILGGMIQIDPPARPKRPPFWLGIDAPPPPPHQRTKWEILIDNARNNVR